MITASDLMVYVKNEVGRNFGVQQTPDFGKLPGHESGGDFIFRLPAARRRPVFQIAEFLPDLELRVMLSPEDTG